jgi:hypothetical protein
MNGSMLFPVSPSPVMAQWTTATRPPAVAGLLGFNTTLGQIEYYNGASWGQLQLNAALLGNLSVTSQDTTGGLFLAIGKYATTDFPGLILARKTVSQGTNWRGALFLNSSAGDLLTLLAYDVNGANGAAAFTVNGTVPNVGQITLTRPIGSATPAAGDNSTLLATTEFVQSAPGTYTPAQWAAIQAYAAGLSTFTSSGTNPRVETHTWGSITWTVTTTVTAGVVTEAWGAPFNITRTTASGGGTRT